MGPPTRAAATMMMPGLERKVWMKSPSLPCFAVSRRAHTALNRSLSAVAMVGRINTTKKLLASRVPIQSAHTPCVWAAMMNAEYKP